MHSILNILHQHPEIVVFLAIAIGYAMGKIKFKGFSLGSTASVLITALVLGQIGVQIPALLETIAFALFIFTIGYKVGPQLFQALKKEGLHFLILSVFFCIISLLTVIFLGKLFAFDAGTTAGILGGSLTQSTIIGTAQDAISNLNLSQSQIKLQQDNVAIAYAITYIFGIIGLIILYRLVPLILKINLKKQAQEIQEEMGSFDNEETDENSFFSNQKLDFRTYRIENSKLDNKTVSDLKKMFPHRVVVEKIKHDNKIVDAQPETIIYKQDVISLIAKPKVFAYAEKIIGPEVFDKNATNIQSEIVNVCVLNKQLVGRALGKIDKSLYQGCFLLKITRQGKEIPITRKTIIHKCDIFQIAGAKVDVEAIVEYIGFPERPTEVTDLITVSLGIVFGTLIGLLAINIYSIPISLGIGGGVLLSGLAFGWLRNLHPTFGQIPQGAQWIFTDLGLNLFIACVGITAGPQALHALQTNGGPILLAGIIVTLVPHITGIIFGLLILKLNPVLLFGGLAGAGTSTPGLDTIQEESDSSIPALGYTIPYAIGNILLTIWGSLIIYLM